MTYEEIKKKIEACADLSIVEEKDAGNSKQLRLSNGAIINCFRTGTHNVQGKNQQQVKDILDGKAVIGGRKVFVVYGHDEIARTQLEAMLRRWDLDPIILDQQASSGQTIIENWKNTVQMLVMPLFWQHPMMKEKQLMKSRISLESDKT